MSHRQAGKIYSTVRHGINSIWLVFHQGYCIHSKKHIQYSNMECLKLRHIPVVCFYQCVEGVSQVR